LLRVQETRLGGMTPRDLLAALALDSVVGLALFAAFLAARSSARYRQLFWRNRLMSGQVAPLVRAGTGPLRESASGGQLLPVAGDEPFEEDDGIGSPGAGGGWALLDDAPELNHRHPADTAPGPLAWLRGVLSVEEEQVGNPSNLESLRTERGYRVVALNAYTRLAPNPVEL
jgi:hypothetical protein